MLQDNKKLSDLEKMEEMEEKRDNKFLCLDSEIQNYHLPKLTKMRSSQELRPRLSNSQQKSYELINKYKNVNGFKNYSFTQNLDSFKKDRFQN